MKLACIALALASLALPALAQDAGGPVTFGCTYPFGDHSLGVLASNSGSDSKDCEATCVAHDSEDDTGDAMRCAIEVQRAMVERNAEVATDKRIVRGCTLGEGSKQES